MTNSADAVEAKIQIAFEAAPYPGDGNLVADQTGRDPECQEIAMAFQGMHWSSVSLEMLREHADALPLFTPAAFRYYLPAYMLGCVRSYDELDVVKDNVIFNLTPPAQPGGWETGFFQARAARFSTAERDAIRSFLALMHERRLADWASQGLKAPPNGLQRALEYWAPPQ